eukprot:CAMPEP_0180680228 /NCGR_PEP_ID=MMETSP1037_2-20121125/69355_1 /TAXON_ID=632150 /ORGANISM="Azadinium spinosum, Strain 3D9" /LENGTH=38 /DNA_ID= /DNA_START= /DNA_END= /DNA_ORIENTATION=
MGALTGNYFLPDRNTLGRLDMASLDLLNDLHAAPLLDD